MNDMAREQKPGRLILKPKYTWWMSIFIIPRYIRLSHILKYKQSRMV